MEAGKLRQRVKIQEKGEVRRDALGGEQITWATFATVWTKVSPMSGREASWFGLETAEMMVTVRMRYYPGILPKMRVLFGTRSFDILSIKVVDEIHREMVLACREIVD